jgi:hypothetical protein
MRTQYVNAESTSGWLGWMEHDLRYQRPSLVRWLVRLPWKGAQSRIAFHSQVALNHGNGSDTVLALSESPTRVIWSSYLI